MAKYNIKKELKDIHTRMYGTNFEQDRIVIADAIALIENTDNLLRERKSIYQKRASRAYEQEKRAKCLLQDEPDREDVKDDLVQCIKLQDRYNALIEFIEELERKITI